MRLPYLYYKGSNSLDFNLIIKTKNTYDGAERDKTYYTVPGRNGNLIVDNGSYKNVVLPYVLTLLENDHRPLRDLAADVRDWLSSKGAYFELWDSYDPDYFRLAAVDGAVKITATKNGRAELTVNFNCKPLRYSFEGQRSVDISAQGGTLYNPEKETALPYIKIYGSGTINMSINSTSDTFTDVSGYIEIDCETMNAYKGTTLLNDKMTGSFPTLQPGDNAITISGTVSKVEIVPRWCRI